MALNLRSYQREATDALYRYAEEGGKSGLIVIPTGGGKSLVIATICKEIIEQYPAMRIGVVTHVKELIKQNTDELLKNWRQAPVGMFSAGVGRKDYSKSPIMFMGVQSVFNKAKDLGPFDLLLIDEAHLVPRSAETMYGRFIGDLRFQMPNMRIVGLTATPYRLDSGRLEGKNGIFRDIIYDVNVRDLIEQGYLSQLISKATLARINTEGLHKRAGEYVSSEIDERARVPSVVESAVKEIVEVGKTRAGWLCFCTSVDHAAQVRDEIRKHGITCEMVVGDTPSGERDRIVEGYKARRIRCLTSVGVLTTGFNAPHVDLIALLRPTLSTGLYVQMVGRGFRLAPGKENCLVLDFAGNVMRHGPVDAITPKNGGGPKTKREIEEDREKEVKGKICPGCGSIAHYSDRTCRDCGFEWPPEAPRHEAEAEEVAILTSEQEEPVPLSVDFTMFERHKKAGMPDSFKATYTCGVMDYRQWLHFEHFGAMREKARIWWRHMGGSEPCPRTVTEALERADAELKWVTGVTVRKNGKYADIVSIHFGEAPSTKPKRVRTSSFTKCASGGWIAELDDNEIPF
jgi:DNA repair protein RadD